MYILINILQNSFVFSHTLDFNFMKKESKEMLKTIISNQELIMKALKIETSVKEIAKELPKKVVPIKKATVKKVAVKRPTKKIEKK